MDERLKALKGTEIFKDIFKWTIFFLSLEFPFGAWISCFRNMKKTNKKKADYTRVFEQQVYSLVLRQDTQLRPGAQLLTFIYFVNQPAILSLIILSEATRQVTLKRAVGRPVPGDTQKELHNPRSSLTALINT